jgi:hypothetical protein
MASSVSHNLAGLAQVDRPAGHKGSEIRQIPTEYLYETLGLYAIPRRRADLPRAKV